MFEKCLKIFETNYQVVGMNEFFTGGHLVCICVCVLVWRLLEANCADIALDAQF